MKKMKYSLAIVLSLVMIFSLCACSIAKKENTGGEDSGEIAEEQAEGEYTLFALEIEGYLVENTALSMESTLTLDQDGTGSMTVNDEGGAVESWKLDGINIVVESGVSTMEGTLKDGVMILDMDAMLAYYAKEGADTSGYDVLTEEEYDTGGGRAAALVKLGKDCYYALNGEGYEPDTAMEYFSAAADLGNADAYYYIGKLHERTNQDDRFEKMQESFQLGVDAGSALCAYGMGRIFQKGYGVDRDYEKAMSYYQEAVDMGLVEANNGIGMLYEDGEGVEKDAVKAIEYYEKATGGKELGITGSAKYSIAYLYYAGAEGIEQDYDKSWELAEELIADGSDYGYYMRALLYQEGKGVEQDYDKAYEDYMTAAEMGDNRSMVKLAYMYQVGQSVEQSYDKQKEWLEKAVELGQSTAMVRLGLYYEGDAVYNPEQKDVDLVKATQYYHRAATAGNIDGIYNVGVSYYNGTGVEKSMTEAYNWFQKAANYGQSWAMYAVGRYYYNGWEPVSKDYAQAKSWFEKALAAGGLTDEQIENINKALAEINK